MITRRTSLKFSAVVLLFLMTQLSCSDSSESVAWLDDSATVDPRPDIVLVVSDDMRWI